jgi:hypothetical protein
MRAPSTRTRKILLWGSGPVAVLLAGAMVWQASDAAFTAETHNSGNNWETGTISLTDDDGGAAMFAAANLTPGQTASRCIVVTANTSVAGTVRMYINSLAAGGLENNITVGVQEGAGSSFAADPTCNNFVPSDPAVVHAVEPIATTFAAHHSYATGMLQWDKSTGVEAKTYKITWKFDTFALSEADVNALQGKNVQAEFEWELQNN